MSVPSVADFVIECRVLPTRPGITSAERLDIVRALIETFYLMPGNGAGGSLHVVLDDCNWEREHVEFCRDLARERDDVAAVALAELLLTLTEAERLAIDGQDDEDDECCPRCGSRDDCPDPTCGGEPADSGAWKPRKFA